MVKCLGCASGFCYVVVCLMESIQPWIVKYIYALVQLID